MKNFNRIILALLAPIVIAGCKCTPDVTVTSVVIDPANPSVERGKAISLKATATLSDGTTLDATPVAVWSSANSSIANVSNADGSEGVTTGVAVGKVKVSALFAKDGSQASAETEVTVTEPPKGSIVVNPRAGLVTTEAGGTATFTVALSKQPTNTVTVGVSSSKTTEGTVSTAVLTFTTMNWNSPQTVTVTGVDDQVADGAQMYTIALANAVSDDSVYNGAEGGTVTVSNTDNDTAGITVSPTTGLTTTEQGGTASFTVVLNSRPTASVTIGLSSSRTGEGTVAPASLTFTTANWNAPQVAIVTGVDDQAADGAQMYVIQTAAAVSDDTAYNGVDGDDVAVSNTDNDSAGVTVTPTSGLVVSEAGSTATFTIALNSAPSAPVTIAISSSNTAEASVSPASLTFTTLNYAARQTVTVTGVDDLVADGPQMFTIVTAAAASSDTNYNNLAVQDVTGTNSDNESAGINVTPTSGLVTSESGLAATFTVVLASRPTAPVTIALSSSNTSEGTVAPASLTFTAMNYNAPQTVTVTGVDDQAADGNQMYNVVTAASVSTDMNYNNVNAADVAVLNIDNDSAGVTVTPTTGLTTTEAGGSASFTVVLNSRPTADVTIALSSDNTAEGTISSAALTFTNVNWNSPRTVTITGQDDSVADGTRDYNIVTANTVSTDTNYNNKPVADVAVRNIDNDSAGITVAPTAGLVTSEAGLSATFTVVLNSQPSANVTINLSIPSASTGEGSVTPASLTFTSANWNAARTVTVTGRDDSIADGTQTYSVVTAAAVSTDMNYSGVNPPDVGVSNIDNDSPGVTVAPVSGLQTTEGGGTDTFGVVLNSQPTANVTISVTSSNTAEGRVSASSLTFTTVNWNAVQTVTVTGQNDSIADGDQNYTIVTGATVSTDMGYSGLVVADVGATNRDNDTPGITVTPVSGLVTSEARTSATFTVVLNTQPAANVTIPLQSSNTAEGVVQGTGSLTFTSTDWDAPKTVTITGVDDSVADGNQAYSIRTLPATGDTRYVGIDALDVSVTNTDNDSAGVTVSVSSVVTSENTVSGSATFSIILNSQPTAPVTIAISSSRTGEATVSPSSLVFTVADYASAAAHTVTVQGVDDTVADGTQTYSIVTGDTVSTDTRYSGLVVPDVAGSNTDNDTAGIIVSRFSGLVTSETGPGTDTFTVALATSPTANVTIQLVSSDTNEGTVSGPAGTSLIFTPANGRNAQTVTVTGVDDGPVRDGDATYSINLLAAVSTDSSYSGLDVAQNVSVTNLDNDTPSVVVSANTLATSEAAPGLDTFSVVLTTRPSAPVTIFLTSTRTDEASVTGSIVFQPAQYNQPITVSVQGLDDSIQDGAQSYSILTTAVSADPFYNGISVADVTGSNADNDTAGVLVGAISGHTNESGGTATFTIELTTEPTVAVTIDVASLNTAEGTVVPSQPQSLVFLPGTGRIPQTVTVRGVNDSAVDGNVTFVVQTSNTRTAGPVNPYSNLTVADVTVTNDDNDTAAIIVSPTRDLFTNENAAALDHTARFTVVLQTQPSADVTIPINSSNSAEGVASPASLIFTSNNWDAPQTVVVTGQDDAVADNAITYTVVTQPAVSSDSNYNGRKGSNVTLVNNDNDSPGITAFPSVATGQLFTREFGAADAGFTLVLNSQPLQPVTINLTSSNTGEGTVSPSQLVFLPSGNDWSTPKFVTVTGVDDAVQDGPVDYFVQISNSTSGDPAYVGLAPQGGSNYPATNVDNDTAGLNLNLLTSAQTTEADAGTAMFTLSLVTQPTAAVSFTIVSSKTDEGSVAPSTVSFNTMNWNIPQTVTVTGVEDFLIDGNQNYNVDVTANTSSDSNYSNRFSTTVALTNIDDDQAFIEVGPVTGTSRELGGGNAQFTLRLRTQPMPGVTVVIPVASDDTTEGTVSPSSITFNNSDWNSLKTVSITGVQDSVADPNVTFHILIGPVTSAMGDPYNGVSCTNVQVGSGCVNPSLITEDDDTAGIRATPNSNITTSENNPVNGGSGQFQVRLTSQPTADVTVAVTSNDTSEGTVIQGSVLTFTPVDWNAGKLVRVRGVDDAIQDGIQAYTVSVTVSGTADTSGYQTVAPATVGLRNLDNDTPGISVSPFAGLVTSEAGGTARFTVVLNAPPAADVTIHLNTDDSGEGQIDISDLTFTALNFAAPQTVTVTGVDDAVADGTQPYSIIVNPASSADLGYNGIDAVDVSVTNTDDDAPGLDVFCGGGRLQGGPSVPCNTLSAPNLPFSYENSILSGDEFSVSLHSEPTANVTVRITVSDTTEGTVANQFTRDVVFTSVNYASPVFVELTGFDDPAADGDQTYTVQFSIIAPTENSGYPTLDAAAQNFDAVNVDNDVTGIVPATSSTQLTVREGGDGGVTFTDTFTFHLQTEPLAPVTFTFTSSDTSEAIVTAGGSSNPLVFNSNNWSNDQTVQVTGVDDVIADGDQSFSVSATSVSTTPLNTDYNGTFTVIRNGQNLDDDSPGVIVSPLSLTVSETGTTQAFTVVLISQPTQPVTIGVHSDDTSEATVNTAALTFNSASWSTPQTVIVTGVDDFVQDGNPVSTIVLDSTVSTQMQWSGLTVDDVSVTTTDNDSAAILVRQADGGVCNTSSGSGSVGTCSFVTREDGGTDRFSVLLNSQPVANVTIAPSIATSSEATLAPSPIVFTAANWNVAQTVTIAGQNELIADGNAAYTVSFANSVSSDPLYDEVFMNDGTGTNLDDDSAALIVTAAPVLDLREQNSVDAGVTSRTFTVHLQSQPVGTITVNITNSDSSEASVSPSSISFNAGNFGVDQTVTVSGVDDTLADGDESFTITLDPVGSSMGDFAYNLLANSTVAGLTRDNEFFVSDLTGNTSESDNLANGEGFLFTVHLTAQPTANVTIPVLSSNSREGTVSPDGGFFTTLVFTPATWADDQAVLVTGVDDAVLDGFQTYTIQMTGSFSADSNFDNLMPSPTNPTLQNADNDLVGISVSPTSGLVTTESGGTATFSIVLQAAPTAPVTINLTSSNSNEGNVNPAFLLFTTTNWFTPQTATVNGEDDSLSDGNQNYTINVLPAVSADNRYSGLNPADVQCTNNDNEPFTPVLTTRASIFCMESIAATPTGTGLTCTFEFPYNVCTQTFTPNASVSVSMTSFPAPTSWTGDCSGPTSSACALIMNASKTVQTNCD